MDYQRGERYELDVKHLHGTDDLESTITATYLAWTAAKWESSDNWQQLHAFNLDEPIDGRDCLSFRPDQISRSRHLPRE